MASWYRNILTRFCTGIISLSTASSILGSKNPEVCNALAFFGVKSRNFVSQSRGPRCGPDKEGDNIDKDTVKNLVPPYNLCCMSGCANCVWLDYADDLIATLEKKGETLKVDELLTLIDDSIDDEMVKAFVKMEVKSRFVFTTQKESSNEKP